MILIASKNIKGITVEIGGDVQGLNKALDSVDKKSQDLSSELKQVNRLLKLDPDNVVLLAQKQKILSEQVENSKDKLEKLKSVQDQIERQYESGQIDDGAYRAFQREIIDAEEALKRANRQIENTGKSMDKVEGKTSSFGSKLKSAGKTAANTFKMVASAAVAFGGAIGAAALSSAGFADEILTTSKNTGLSAEYLQQYAYAAELVDVDLETMTKSMSKNIKSMSNAKKGTKDYVDAYKQLGVKVTTASGALRDSETVYWEVIDALGNIEDETKRDAISMQIFGKSAQELNSLIAVGSKGMKEYAKEAENAGAVLDTKTLQALGNLDDSYQRLSSSMSAWKNQIGAAFAPEIKTVIDKLIVFGGKTIPKIQNFIKNAITYIKSFLPQINAIYNASKRTIKTIMGIIGDVAFNLKPLFKDVFDIIINTLKFIAPTLKKIYTLIRPIVSAVSHLAGWVVKIVDWASELVFSISGTSDEVAELSDRTEDLTDNVSNAKEEWQDLNESAGQSLIDADESVDNITLLRDQLSLLVDENGNLIGSEDSLRVVLKKLSDEGFSANYNSQKKQITNYQKLREEIQKTIDLKLYESRINALADVESEAWKTQIEALSQYEDLNAQLTAVNKELEKIAEFNPNTQEWVLTDSSNWEDFVVLQEQYYAINKSMLSAKDTYNDATAAIEAYKLALAAGAEGDYAGAIKIAEDYFKTTVEGITNNKEVTLQSLAELESGIENKISATQSALATYDFDFARKIRSGLDDLLLEYVAKGGNIDKYADQFRLIGYELPEALAAGINENTETAKNAGKNMAAATEEGTREESETHSPSRVFMRLGQNLVDGLIIGMRSRENQVRSVSASIARIASNAMKAALKINSPSKLTRSYGQFFSEGLERGMLDRIRDVQNVSARLAASAAMPIANTSSSSFNIYNTNHFNTTAARDGAALVRQINRDLGAMYYKR